MRDPTLQIREEKQSVTDLSPCFLLSQPSLCSARPKSSSVKFYLVLQAKIDVAIFSSFLIQSFFLDQVFTQCFSYWRHCSSLFFQNSQGYQKNSNKTVLPDIITTLMLTCFLKVFQVLFFSPPKEDWDSSHTFTCQSLIPGIRHRSIPSYLNDVIRTL